MIDKPLSSSALIDPAAMSRADKLATEMGISSVQLMENAGAAVAIEAARLAPGGGRIALLAGQGKNGGDAFVAARHLAAAGYIIDVFSLSEDKVGSETRSPWTVPVQALADFDPRRFDLVVDGLFGAGLSRPIEGTAADAIRSLNACDTTVLAIDLPSGVCGLTGAVLGVAVEATCTVTFARRKPGHLLMPGRKHCGPVVVADVGMPDEALRRVAVGTFANEPGLWQHALLQPGDIGHKYDRGHAIVFSGGASRTGAARMSAMAALRGGAGLVTIASPASALLVNAMHVTAIMLRRCEDAADLLGLLEDERLNAFVLGPGFGIGGKAREFALKILEAGRRLILDADAITSFKDDAAALFERAQSSAGSLVVTPHAGEFKRLFPEIAQDASASKLQQAREAARLSGAIVVFKGADTVVASPDGRAAVNATGTNWLATAGTGDVLAGIIASQLAQGVPVFEAACAGVWMHGRTAELFGPGLIAEDLPSMLPRVHAELSA